MSLTTSTFLLKTLDESQYTGTSLTFGTVSISATNNILSLDKPSTSYTITIPIGSYGSIGSLITKIQEGMDTAKAPFTAFASGTSVGIKTTGVTFFINATPANGANVILGLPATRVGSGNLYFYKSYTFPPIDFYPPSTISDCNVFMQLVNAEMFGNALDSARVPFVISLQGLPQPVGTYSDTENGCRSSTFLGHVCTRGHGERGPRILTHIPDGLQQLTFQIDQLYQADRDLRISANMVFAVTIEFEVSTSK